MSRQQTRGLFTGQAANGVSDTYTNNDESASAIVISGTFTAGTLKLQCEDPRVPGTWVDLDGLSWTATGGYSVTIPRGLVIRADLSGFTGNINATLT